MTVTLTDAERVDVLLDENQRLRDELNATRRDCRSEIEAEQAAERRRRVRLLVDGPVDATLDVVRASNVTLRERVDACEAANDALREALRTAERERVDAQVVQYAAEAECEQLRRELAVVRPDRPSAVYSLSRLVGVAIGAGLVGVVAGASVAAEIVGRLPW